MHKYNLNQSPQPIVASWLNKRKGPETSLLKTCMSNILAPVLEFLRCVVYICGVWGGGVCICGVWGVYVVYVYVCCVYMWCVWGVYIMEVSIKE